MVDVLGTGHHGYQDFAVFQRSGRGGFLVRAFTWDGQHYKQKANWEMTEDALYNRG